MQITDRHAPYELSSMLPIQESLTVSHLAAPTLCCVDPDWTARRVLSWFKDEGFDVAPVEESPRHRYVDKAFLRDAPTKVDAVARFIDATQLVTPDLSLLDAIDLLESKPWYFVLGRTGLTGIITRADLQRPVVSMVAFSLILSAEAGMNKLIEADFGDNWNRRLGAQLPKVQAIYESRVDSNAQITLLQCLNFDCRLDLVGKSRGIREQLGFRSKREFDNAESQLKKVRDVLAHGTTLLDLEHDPLVAIRVFKQVRVFTERVWNAVGLLGAADALTPAHSG
jgi:hypothetical protein